MDRELANNILRNGGSGQAGLISFARCNQETIETIEAMGDEELNSAMRSAYWMTYIYEQFSIADLQYVELLSLELDSRGWTKADWDKFNEWADNEKIKFDEEHGDEGCDDAQDRVQVQEGEELPF
jgi:hypothetical protein